MAELGWRRPLRWIAGSLVACAILRWAVPRLFGDRAARDAVRRFNRRWLNPVMLRFAGRPHWYAARLEHLGRHTGHVYATPVVAKAVTGGFAVPLPYGRGVDWLRNLQAAGRAWLQVDGERYRVGDPRIVPVAEIETQLPAYYRRPTQRSMIPEWLVLTAERDAVARPPSTRAPRAVLRQQAAAAASRKESRS
jgi:deazaflavin-dependent oxidoreductase (nitroreductase family)